MGEKTIKTIVAVGLVAGLASCSMGGQKSAGFTDFLTAGMMSGNGMYVTMGDAKGIEAHSNYQNGIVTSAKIDSVDQKSNPYWTVEGEKASQRNALQAKDNRIIELQQKLNNLATMMRGGE